MVRVSPHGAGRGFRPRGESAMKKIRAWHFSNGTLHYQTSMTIEAGRVYSIEPDRKPALCSYGMHGSKRAIDALQWAKGPIISRVDIWGDVEEDNNKLCGRHREVLWVANATRMLHEFACWCVRSTPLGDGRTVWDSLTDRRSQVAVETKERWLRGEATNAELTAAQTVASAASRRAAGQAVAWATARGAAALAAQNAELEQRLFEMGAPR